MTIPTVYNVNIFNSRIPCNNGNHFPVELTEWPPRTVKSQGTTFQRERVLHLSYMQFTTTPSIGRTQTNLILTGDYFI